MIQAKVALSKDFMEQYSKLPKKIQKKVREFTEKLHHDPTQPGLNFESIEQAKDSKVRSVRIDQAYRAILVHPPKGDVYLCVWVDHHDAAYQWAVNRRFEVNPKSGSFQIFDLEESADVIVDEEETVTEYEQPRLFDDHDDEDLLFAGVPQPLLASVREVITETDLDKLSRFLPPDASEMLYMLAAGYDLLEAIEETAREKPKPAPVPVDVEDFEAALTKPEAQQQFKIVGDEEELQAMLDAPLEQWRIFLHPSQKKLVEMNANGPIRVLGGAGTGKTVALLHRANHLASTVFKGENDRLLVTTYTKNLALDLKMNLRNLCDPDVFERIDVNNLHSWAASYMSRQGHSIKVIHADKQKNDLMEQAFSEAPSDDFPLGFYRDEWEQVVQAQEVQTRDDYLTARRVGRGTRLSRRQRADVWVVLQRYRELLNEGGWHEYPDLIRETRMYIEKRNLPSPYRAVLCDEVQDFTASELRLLRTLAPDEPNTLFLVGDGHQRIYGRPVSLSSCGIEIRGRSRRLKLNYRTTQQIRENAVLVLEGKDIDDLDAGTDTLDGYFSLRTGPHPEIVHHQSEADEAQFIVDKVRSWLAADVPASSICIAARTHAQIEDRYVQILQGEEIDYVIVEKDPESEAKKDGVRVATMHRMKGLEFSRVLLAGVQKGKVPLEVAEASTDAVSESQHDLRERCLFYVASTRARDELVITGYGEKSGYLAKN